MSKKKAPRITTPEGRLSFPALFEAKSFEDQAPKFSAELILPKDADLSALKAACAEILAEKFPNAETRPRVALPIKDGSTKNKERLSQGREPRPEIEGMLTLAARTGADRPPALVDQNVQPITNQALLYGGCYVRLSVTPYWFDKGVNRGLALALNAVQFVRDGEPFGNPFDANEAFSPIPGATASADADGMFV